MVRVRCYPLFVCIIQSVFNKSIYFFFQTILIVCACRIIVSLFWAETRREKFHIPTADGQTSQYPVLTSLMELCAVLLMLRDKNAPNCMIMVLNNWTNYSNGLDMVKTFNTSTFKKISTWRFKRFLAVWHCDTTLFQIWTPMLWKMTRSLLLSSALMSLCCFAAKKKHISLHSLFGRKVAKREIASHCNALLQSRRWVTSQTTRGFSRFFLYRFPNEDAKQITLFSVSMSDLCQDWFT